MKRTSFEEMDCSIARTLNLIGEWWTPLILRDIFMGVYRFEALLKNTGISRNILTDRLQTLVENEILERRLYQENPPRYEYRLTERGEDLFPILMTVMAWGDKWLNMNKAPTELVHLECGKVTKPRLCCSKCGKELTRRTVRARPGPGGSGEYWEAIKAAREAAKTK